ncbi:MAG TPA: 3,4-dihydroxy-2-butanone-4-phosphate synthase [Planctomycetota bacterium]
MTFSPVSDLIEQLRLGRLIVLVDDVDPEKGSDLCCAAQFATPELVKQVIDHSCGFLCLALAGSICDRLGLELMEGKFSVAFTESIDAARGVTTGISSADRAHTIQAAVHPAAKPEDLVRPGHVFPVRAHEGGVLTRPATIEGIVDLCRFAGITPAGLISEIVTPDGEMACAADVELLCARRGLLMGCITDLVEYGSSGYETGRSGD